MAEEPESPPSFWALLRGAKSRRSTIGQPLQLPNPEATMTLGEYFKADPFNAALGVLFGASPLPIPGYPETQASRFGQVLGAAVPLVGGMKSLKALAAGEAETGTAMRSLQSAPVQTSKQLWREVQALEQRAAEWERIHVQPLMEQEQRLWDTMPKQGGLGYREGSGWYGYETGHDFRDPNHMARIDAVRSQRIRETQYVQQLRDQAQALRADMGAVALMERGTEAAISREGVGLRPKR